MPFFRRVRSACIYILHVMKGLFQCIHMTLSSVGALLFVVPLAIPPPPPPPPLLFPPSKNFIDSLLQDCIYNYEATCILCITL